MFKNFVDRLAGNPYERELENYREIVGLVADLEPEMEAMSPDDMRALTASFRAQVREAVEGIEDKEERLAEEEAALSDILPQAFALVREASRRTIGLRHFDVQIIGGIVLHEGKIAEMRTGEGKTLVATLPLYLNALTGRGAHLVTVNDYLARRDGGWMGPIYHLLGMSVSVIGKEQYSAIYDPDYVDPGGDLEDERLVHWRPTLRRECYQADVTYGTAPEFGFDYLRDNTAVELIRTVQRGHPYVIVDEVDSVLIDGARTPLIISGPAAQASSNYERFAGIIKNSRLRRNTTDLKYEEPDGDYDLDDRTQSVSLTDRGIEKVERQLTDIVNVDAGESMYDPQHYELVHYLENALKAQIVFKRDKDYIVQDERVILVDQTTGRPMPSRRYSEGLHQAIEAKEGVRVRREDVTIATITVQNYFRLYDKLSGMTGTAVSQAEEFDEVYELDVIAIPTNVEYQAASGEFETRQDKEEGVPVVTYWEPDNDGGDPDFYKRVDYPDQVYISIDAKFNAVANEIGALTDDGRPILVGTGSVEASETLSGKLKGIGLPHEVLNAKNHDREALIVAQAGRPGSVTISTSMAGRGTDILLGGNPEGLANKMIAEKCFAMPAFHQVVEEVVDGSLEKARELAAAGRYMDKSVADWVAESYEDLARKAEVTDVIGEVARELQGDPAYQRASFDDLLKIIQQVELAQLDMKRLDRARSLAEECGLPLALIPDAQYRLNEFHSLAGLLGQAGLVDTLARLLFEKHYNARAALVRAVLADKLDEAKRIVGQVPALPASLIDDIQAVRDECRRARESVWEAGGLHVIGTERHESRRIDDQLRGRAARQGDPGSSRFYLSLEDDLMMRFGGERTKRMMDRLNIPDDIPIAANILSNAIEQAQGRFETYHFEIRKNLIEYDEAVNRQRQIVYDERHSILEGDGSDLDNLVKRFILESLEKTIIRLRDDYEEWAMEEVDSVLTDFSNQETGEVNTRGVVQRVQSLFPRLTADELADLLAITDEEALHEELHELILDGVEAGHNMRMLHAEIARIVPLWPVLPPIGPRGAEGWELFVKAVRGAFEGYVAPLPDDLQEAIWTPLKEGLEHTFRELVATISQGSNPGEAQQAFYQGLNRALSEATSEILSELEHEELLDALTGRVDALLELTRQPGGAGADEENGSGWRYDRQVFSIGQEEVGNYERALMLTVIDGEWRQYLQAIDDLRQGVGLEAFGQRDPKVQFKRRAFEMFDKLRDDVQADIARRFFGELPRHRQIVEHQKRQEQLLDQISQAGYRVQRQVTRTKEGQVRTSQTIHKDVWSQVGRNDPCPCGSGKKFKDCHYNQIRQQQQTGNQPVRGGSSRKRRRR
jgi:preprotein translocase subunit SecA